MTIFKKILVVSKFLMLYRGDPGRVHDRSKELEIVRSRITACSIAREKIIAIDRDKKSKKIGRPGQPTFSLFIFALKRYFFLTRADKKITDSNGTFRWSIR